MKKRILAAIATIFFIIPALTQSAIIQTSEDLSPSNILAVLEVKLGGKLQNFFKEVTKQPLEDLPDPRLKMLINKVLNGDRVFVSAAPPQSVLVSMPVNDSEWEILIKDLDKHTYDEVDLYNEGNNETADSDFYIAKIDNFAVGGTIDAVHHAVDLAHGKAIDSLNSNTDYKNFVSSYFSPSLFSITLNNKEISKLLEQALGGDEAGKDTKQFLDYMKIFEFLGINVAEMTNGYKFHVKVKGNAEELAKNEMSFNPGGNFTPNLYKKFPNAKPIFYQESFNGKAGFEQAKNFLNKSLAYTEKTADDFFDELKDNLGLDIEELAGTMNRETAFSLQYDQNSPIPYATLLANVSDNKAAAEKVVNDVTKFIKKLRSEDDEVKKVLKINSSNGFTKFIIDITKAPDYEGPPFPLITITLGVSEDGLLILSNYPGIEDSGKRVGFASNPDFNSFASEINKELTGVLYLNARNAWGAVDEFAAWAEKAGAGEHGPPLDFYQGYYSLLEKIYTWRDLLVVTNNTSTEQSATGFITIDQAKHKTYAQLLDEIKSSDRDGDGISDYDERYVYNTPMDSGDIDNDGVSDFEELMKGENPNGEGRLFKDVSEDSYYTDEVSFLQQRGAISGYSDKSFQPGRLVNRAEFTTMVVKAFEQDTSNYLGVDVELSAGAKYATFADIDPTAWYAMPLAKAYGAGFVSGSPDPKTGELRFRPGDNITRAEAIAILNKASAALQKTRPTATCANSAFKDVASDAWYCDAVANAYENGITKGRSEGIFDPNGKLNRAEAAVMIRRTLEKDIAVMSAGTQSFGEMAAPISAPLAPIFGPTLAP